MSTGKLRFLTLVKPVLHVLPEVAQPDRKIPFKVRQPRQPHVLSGSCPPPYRRAAAVVQPLGERRDIG